MRNKRGKTSPVVMLLAVTLIGVLLFSTGILGNIGGDKKTGTITNPTCDSTTTPALNIKAVNKETGTALTEATNLWRKKGDIAFSTFTAGTGFAVGVGDTLEVVMGIDTSDFTDNAYGEKFEYTVGCEETPSIEKEMVNDEIETSLTATFYNADADAGAETFTAGQTQDVSVKLQAGVKEYFGNPFLTGNPNVLVIALNSTEWDTPEKVYIRGGAELKRVDVPLRQSSASGLINYAFELPVISDEQIEVVMKLNADDTTAPATDMTGYMYAGGYYYNQDSRSIEVGVENEEGSAVGTDASDTVTLDFTA